MFNLKTPGPQNNILIKKYKEKYEYTYIGMQNALKYFYEVKRRKTDKAEERVGIIPYVYEDAQEYFKAIENRVERIGNHALDEQPKEITINICPTQKIEKKNTGKSDLDSLFDEE